MAGCQSGVLNLRAERVKLINDALDDFIANSLLCSSCFQQIPLSQRCSSEPSLAAVAMQQSE